MNYTPRFDDLFRSTAAKYMTGWQGVPWQWLKAQAICESNMDPDTHASDGGMGLAQFQPGTWHDMCVRLNWWDDKLPLVARPSAFDPKYAIPAMGYYLRSLWLEWTAPRPVFDRMQLTWASYNAGQGSLLRAQRLADGARDFDSIIAKLPDVTGAANAGITQRYCARIASVYGELTTG